MDCLQKANSHGIDPLQAFSRKATFYHNRPRYPQELLDLLIKECGLTPEWIITDIGSGTGFLSGLFVKNGNTVFAVEPNDEMGKIAEDEFINTPAFRSLQGRAEEIPLPTDSTDMVTIGQALHWFNIDPARDEILRILRPGGWIVVVDNVMRNEGSTFMQAYHEFRGQYFTDLGKAANPPEKIVKLFGNVEYQYHTLSNPFVCKEPVFRAGILSSAIAPLPESAGFAEFEDALHALFTHFQEDGKVEVLFDTVVWMGTIK